MDACTALSRSSDWSIAMFQLACMWTTAQYMQAHIWLCGWMGGWMGGWVDGWVDGWVGGWVGGWMKHQFKDL